MIEQTNSPKPMSQVGQFAYLDVNMSTHFDYDTPDTLPEWGWIENHARWAHRGNGEEVGVWEFMVLASTLEDHPELVPASLKPFFEHAIEAGCIWIMFQQS